MEFEKLEKKEFSLQWIIVAILTILLVIQTVIFFIYSNYDGVSAKTLKKEYVKVSDIKFDVLSYTEKEKYVKKEEYQTLEERYGYLKEENIMLSKKVDKLSNGKEFLSTTRVEVKRDDKKTKELEKESGKLKDENHKLRVEVDSLKSQVEKLKKGLSSANKKASTIVTKESSKDEVEDKKEYYETEGLKQVGFVSCKDMNLGAYNVTKECRKQVESYLKTMPKDGVYEVIAMISKDDKKMLSDMSSTIDELAVSGLGRFRVREAKWLLTKHIGEDVKIKLVSYDTTTNESRGFVIKAYK